MFSFSSCRACLLPAVLTLTACTSMTIYHRDGAAVSRIDTELASCQASALDQVPPDIRQRYIPPVYNYEQSCNAYGYCISQPVLVTPGYYTSYDANEGARGTVAQSCMTNKGFSEVSLPLCSSDVIQATTITRTRIQPPLTDASCIIRIRSGGYQIVNP